MRLRFVPFATLAMLFSAQAFADGIPTEQSLAGAALGQGLISPGTFQIPDLAAPLEKAMSQELPNGGNVSLYAGYPGPAALGPAQSSPLIVALDGLQAPSGEGWLDQSFVAYGVVTAGLTDADQQLEISRFTGHTDYRGPYDIARLDSTSVRYTWKAATNWTLQGSWGSLKSPEVFAPEMDENRWTASAKYSLPFGRDGSWSAMLVWGMKQQSTGDNLNAVALDAECKPLEGWTVFARGGFEQDNALLADGAFSPAGVRNNGSASVGTVHDWKLFDQVQVGAGGLYAFSLSPSQAFSTPVGPAKGAVAYVHLVAH